MSLWSRWWEAVLWDQALTCGIWVQEDSVGTELRHPAGIGELVSMKRIHTLVATREVWGQRKIVFLRPHHFTWKYLVTPPLGPECLAQRRCSNKVGYYYQEACVSKVCVTGLVVTLIAKARYKILFNPPQVTNCQFLFRETEAWVDVVNADLKPLARCCTLWMPLMLCFVVVWAKWCTRF